MTGAGRWLWITAELPWDRSTGRLVYSADLARSVAAAGAEMTMVGLGDGTGSPDEIRSVAVAGDLRGGWRSLASPLPNLAYACATPQMRAAVADLLTQAWDVVVIDHLQAAWAAAPAAEAAARARRVFVTHNHESSVRRHVASQAPIRNGRRLALGIDAAKAARLERATLGRVALVTSITDADRERFGADAPDVAQLVLAPGWSGGPARTGPPAAERPRRVAMVGSFEWHVKQENLRRFVTVADPILAEAGVELVVGGTVPENLRAELGRATRATRFVGWVDSVPELLAGCRIGVIAEPLGGGFKIKSLDYVFNGVPVAAVAGSVAGLPLEPGTSMVEATDEAQLARSIVAVIDDAGTLDDIAAKAVAVCEPVFGWQQRAEALLHAVDSLR